MSVCPEGESGDCSERTAAHRRGNPAAASPTFAGIIGALAFTLQSTAPIGIVLAYLIRRIWQIIPTLFGVILLVLTLLLSFTGYLLPWDQLAIWAITVGSNMARATPLMGVEGPGASFVKLNGVSMITSGSDAKFALLGGRSVGEMTLNRFYVLHCVAIPLAAALLIMIHFWRVRKDGGISGPM